MASGAAQMMHASRSGPPLLVYRHTSDLKAEFPAHSKRELCWRTSRFFAPHLSATEIVIFFFFSLVKHPAKAATG
jgi:hypothetical protein